MIEMDGKGSGCNVPRKMNSKKPLDGAHEFNLVSFGQKKVEQRFNLVIFRDIHKVIHIKAKGERLLSTQTQKYTFPAPKKLKVLDHNKRHKR